MDTVEKLREARIRHSALTDEFVRDIHERTEAAMLMTIEALERGNKEMEDYNRKREVEKRRNQVFNIDAIRRNKTK